MAPKLRSVSGWFEERTGLGRLIRAVSDEPIPGGPRWAYVFGGGLLFLFLLQAVTGAFLVMYYVPSSDHAHSSVAYIEKAVAGGSFLRGLHYYGASAMILVLALHLAQTLLFGAYKGRRELNWISGLILLPLVLLLGFTGYLLPWDQEAYFGTKVGANIAAEVPVVGPWLARLLLGGRELTTISLSRFFVLHILFVPGLILIFVVAHLFLFRKAGPAGSYHEHDPKTGRFYPKQFFYDTAFVFALFVLLSALAVAMPVPLGPLVDPTSDYLARPAWYFLPLFELLKYFPGELSLIPSVILPGILFAALILLPFFDRKSERHPLRRPVATILLAGTLALAASLIALAKVEDRRDPSLRAKLEQQARDARAFARAPFEPQQLGRTVPMEAPMAMNPVAAVPRSLRLYFANCANCHGADARGGPLGPALAGLARRRGRSKEFLVRFLEGHGRSPRLHRGEPSPNSMPAFAQLAEEDRVLLAEFLRALDSPIPVSVTSAGVPTGRGGPPMVFLVTCAMCHGPNAEGNIGPTLIGITLKPNRTEADIVKILEGPRAYGLKEPMPESFPKLTEEDRRQIAAWLASTR